MQLLEREPYFTDLKALLAEAVAGHGRMALVSGEAGIGKTSLLERFTLDQRGARVWWGACDRLFTPRPLGPLHDIALQMRADWPARLEVESDRAALFSAFLNELQLEATIVVIEDVHWADEATLDLLKFLGRRIQRTRALLIVTYRDDEIGPRHPLRTVLGEVGTSSAIRRLVLTPLSEKAVRTLIGPQTFEAAVLHRQTGGNPFFVTEILAGGTSGVPETIRDAVLARAARLSPSARAVLEAAAIIGGRIEPWLLAEVTGAEAYAVDQCLHVGMLVANANWLMFRHELARQTILDAIAPHQQVVLHRLVLAALKASPITRTDDARLAHHAEAVGDREALLTYAPAAARHAASASAHREAANLYALARRFASDLPADQYALLLEAYAVECDAIGQQADGIAARRTAIDLWRALDNRLKQGENLAHLMTMLNRVGQNAEAQQVSREAIDILEALPAGRELALAYRMQAAVCLVNRDCEDALAWAQKALHLAEQFEAAEVLAAIHVTSGTAWLFLDYARGCANLESKIDWAQQAGLSGRVAHMYSNLTAASGEVFQLSRGEQYAVTGIAFALERDLDSHRLYMQAWQAMIWLYLGRWAEAAQQAATVLNSSGVTVISRIATLTALGRVRSRRGDDEAAATLDEALTFAARADNLQRLGPVRAARAEAAWFAADHDRVLTEARAVYDLAIAKRHPWLAGELAYWRWRGGDRFSIPDWLARPYALQLRGEWRAAAEEWKRLDCPYEQARALADGDTDALISALAVFERLGAKPAIEEVRQALRAAGVRNLPRSTTRENPYGLTARQMDILALLAESLSNTEIAVRLSLSPKTVDHHVSAVLAKLDVHSREEAAQVAKREGMVKPK
jgi:DNA-binding CsgD family transcriptional regulator